MTFVQLKYQVAFISQLKHCKQASAKRLILKQKLYREIPYDDRFVLL